MQLTRRLVDEKDHAAAALVLDAAEAWSPKTHKLWPTPARERAIALLLLGTLLSCEARFSGAAQSIKDVWLFHVMPFAIEPFRAA